MAMATSNPLRIRNKSGRDIDILCGGAATDEPVSPRTTTLPSPNDIRASIPERRRVGAPLPPWQPQDMSLPLRQRSPLRSPASHRSPIQLPPLGEQRSAAPELRRRRTHWDLNPRDDGVADYAHDPFAAPDMRGALSSNSLSASARDYYHHMGEDRRHSFQDSMMRPRHGRHTSPPTPGLFRCGSRDSINTVDPVSPSTPRDALPEYGYPPSRNASFSSMGPGSMYPDPTQFEPGTRHFDGYAKPPQAPLPRFPGTLPAPHNQMHAHHYHDQHYHDPAMAAYAVAQGHMVPQIPAFAPPPATTVTASGTKRYHCRYADAVGCDKTFTTSGHASRHSKIHTCEKGIQCAFTGCPKKFTRADNMKQHLETHFKDARRPRLSSTSSASSTSRRTMRKNASATAVAMRREGRGLSRDMVRLQARQQQEVSRWPSHLERGESSSMGAARERSEDNVGLDALAAAVEHEEGAKSQSPERSQEGTPGPARV